MENRRTLCAFYIMAKIILSEVESEELLCEVITGKKVFWYDGSIFAVRYPDSREKDSSRIIYVSKCKELEKQGLPYKEDFKVFLLKNGCLEHDFYNKINNTEEIIKKILKAREKTASPVQMAKIEADLVYYYELLNAIKSREDVLMLNTIESGAEVAKLNYLISKCVLVGIELEKRFWESYDDYLKFSDIEFVSICKQKYRELMVGMSPSMIRAIARSQDWKKRWEISKKTGTPVFDGNSSNWDKNKIELCYWSNFYDNIIEHFNLKGNEILDDDDALFEMIRVSNNGQGRKLEEQEEKGKSHKVINTPFKVRY